MTHLGQHRLSTTYESLVGCPEGGAGIFHFQLEHQGSCRATTTYQQELSDLRSDLTQFTTVVLEQNHMGQVKHTCCEFKVVCTENELKGKTNPECE